MAVPFLILFFYISFVVIDSAVLKLLLAYRWVGSDVRQQITHVTLLWQIYYTSHHPNTVLNAKFVIWAALVWIHICAIFLKYVATATTPVLLWKPFEIHGNYSHFSPVLCTQHKPTFTIQYAMWGTGEMEYKVTKPRGMCWCRYLITI
jgi:hypothetical protein